MTIADNLISKVSKIIQDSSFSNADILGVLNSGVQAIAAGPIMTNGARLAPMPELFTDDTVDTATDASRVNLPAEYQRDLRMVVSGESGERIRIEPSFEKFMRRNPQLDEEGTDVDEVTIMGRRLFYRPKPTSAVTLTLYFYRKPVDMAEGDEAEQQEPDGLPDHLYDALLVNYAAREIFETIDGDDGLLASTINKHDANYQKALYDLSRFVGPMRNEPWNVGDDDYDLQWFDEAY